MSGFTLKLGLTPSTTVEAEDDKFSYNSIVNEEFDLQRKTIKKFLKDKLFEENEKFIVVIEGVILNKVELINSVSWFETIQKMYLEFGDMFFKFFRGTFSGALYDKEKEKWLIFTDHIGSKRVYYSELCKGKFVFSSHIKTILKTRKQNGLNNNLNINGAYMLLSYGYLIEKLTLTEGINKLLPGHYITIQNDKLTTQSYHRFTNEPNYSLSEKEIIDKTTTLFNKAIKRQFDKDLEYNYKHFVGLSGGLDSRVTSVVAHELGYNKQLNFTFSQSDYLDETIPKKIAEDLRHEWIFKALDNGLFLKNIDETTKISEGVVSYFNLVHGLSMYKYINFDNLGIIHTGQLGDVILGTFYSTDKIKEHFEQKEGAFSDKYLSKISLDNIDLSFKNEEIYKFYLRGFSGANAGLLALQYYSETMSPFYDVDFMEFALSIPVEKRYDHGFYKKWIQSEYPVITNYIWEKTGAKPILNKFSVTINGKKLSMRQFLNKVMRRIGFAKKSEMTKEHMNPFSYWIKNNIEIKHHLDKYFNDNKNKIEDVELKKDAIEMYNTGSSIEKGMVISLLSYIKLMHPDHNKNT